jgi:hypothetical protein
MFGVTVFAEQHTLLRFFDEIPPRSMPPSSQHKRLVVLVDVMCV